MAQIMHIKFTSVKSLVLPSFEADWEIIFNLLNQGNQ